MHAPKKSFLTHKHVIIPDITELYFFCTFSPSQNELAINVAEVSHFLKANGASQLLIWWASKDTCMQTCVEEATALSIPKHETVSALCYGMLVCNFGEEVKLSVFCGGF